MLEWRVHVQAQRDKELVSFKSHFEDVTFKKGMDVRLALSSDGSVTTVIDGAKVWFPVKLIHRDWQGCSSMVKLLK